MPNVPSISPDEAQLVPRTPLEDDHLLDVFDADLGFAPTTEPDGLHLGLTREEHELVHNGALSEEQLEGIIDRLLTPVEKKK